MFFFGTTLFVSAAASIAVEAQDGFSVAEQYSFPETVDGRRKLESKGDCFSEFTYTNAEDWNNLKLANVDCESSCDAKTAQSPLDYTNGDYRSELNFNPSTHQLKIQWDTTPFKGKTMWRNPPANSMSQKYSCKNCDNMKVVLNSPDFEKETTFVLAQHHMHVPSENTINGKHATAEIHFVHVSADAKPNEPHYLVIGIMLDITLVEKEVSPFAKALFTDSDGNPAVGKGDLNEADWKTLWFLENAPLNGHFWHNKGSLTTPPCTEAVEWFVMETPLKVTMEMVTRYREVLKKHEDTPHSARPTQNANNKSTIYYGSLKVTGDDIEGVPPPKDTC